MEHFYKGIQGWFTYQKLYREMVAAAPADRPSVFVEIGSWNGQSAAFMGVEIINSGKPIFFHCVDTFKGSDEEEHKADAAVKSGSLEEMFRANLMPVSGYMGESFVVHPMTSVEAAGIFTPKVIDFLFLDASHDYQSVRDDIHAWRPKIKPGGVMAGHDWWNKGVRHAVEHSFTNEMVHLFVSMEQLIWKFNVPAER